MTHQQMQTQRLKRSTDPLRLIGRGLNCEHVEEELWLRGVTVRIHRQGNSQRGDVA